MKKKIVIIILSFLTAFPGIMYLITLIPAVPFTFQISNKVIDEPISDNLVIQYADDFGTYLKNVEYGQPFSIDTIPQKFGYDFLGLYDAEVGGTQYTASTGSSLGLFKNKKSLVLYPQFKAKDYNVVLDYQGTPTIGQREYVVKYGSKLPSLPKHLTKDNSEFKGWFTKPNCKGLQVADEKDLIAVNSVVNENNFDLKREQVIYLYAGFQTEKFDVTLYLENGKIEERQEIEYNTPIKNIVPETRVNGNAVLTWSKSRDGYQPFDGYITDDTILYAIDYAPILEFNSNGGYEVLPIIAKENAVISLPIPKKENYKFLYWADETGNEVDITRMPKKSMSLTAVWQTMITFNSNGGSKVDDIIAIYGDNIKLPIPQKEKSIFEGWYTLDGNCFSDKTMPKESVELYARWGIEASFKLELERKNCNDNNNYNSDQKGSSSDIKSHEGWDLFSLSVSGCSKDSNGYYYFDDVEKLTFTIEFLQNLSNNTSPNGFKWDISNDTYTSATNTYISKRIGYVAYQIYVTYDDDSYDWLYECNIMEPLSKGDKYNLKKKIASDKKVKDIKIEFFYEIRYTNGGSYQYSNWRSTSTMNFK